MQSSGKLTLTLPSGQRQEFALAAASIAIGRATTNDIVLPDVKVSRAHARLECSEARCVLVDLGSANGTRLNGQPVQRATLAPGDSIALGDSTLIFEADTPQAEPDVTVIESEADLEATLAHATLSMTVSNTRTARLAVQTPGKTWEVELTNEALTIGRHPSNDVVLDHGRVSRNHARIERRRDSFLARDLGSTNGTWLGEQRIEEHMLQDGDTIRIGEARIVFKAGFAPEDLTVVETLLPQGRAMRRPVVIVPGFMGSELWRGSERVWLNVKNVFAHPDILRYPEVALEARALAPGMVIVPNLIKLEQYGRLIDYLEESLGYESGKDLLAFPYDWRQDLRISARQLAEAIDAWQGRSREARGPVTMVAHSMGCLLSRYYVERLGGKARVGRLVLVGGPHAGAPRTLEAFAFGRQPFILGRLAERFQRVVVSFPSIYTILPTYRCVYDASGRPLDLNSDTNWAPAECRAYVPDARRFHQELGTKSSVPTVSVFGYGLKTICRVVVDETGPRGWEGMHLMADNRGDDMVPEDSALVEGAEIHPVLQHHGALYVDNDVKMRLKRELTQSHPV